MSNRIVLADDETRITAFTEEGLRKHGFITLAVHDGESAARLARSEDFDLVILDIGLPRLDVYEALNELGGRGERIPVILLTARNELESTVRGFEYGADDYVTKPFRFDELLARVRAHIREPGPVQEHALIVGGVTGDLLSHIATVSGIETTLSSREFALAETLMSHTGAVLSGEQLLNRVWGYDFEGSSNVVEVHIRYLRRKLGADVVETIRGSGYCVRR